MTEPTRDASADAPEREPDTAPRGKATPFMKEYWTEERRQAQRERLIRMRAEGKMRGGRRKAGAAPRASAPPTGGPGRPADRRPATARQKPLRPRLTKAYETVGTLVGFVSPADGRVILANAESCAEAVAEWAEQDPRVREALERMLSGSAMGKVVIAHLPIALGVAANHGALPSGLLGGLFTAPAPPSTAPNGYDPMAGYMHAPGAA